MGLMTCLGAFGASGGNYKVLFYTAAAMVLVRWTATDEDKF